MATCLRVNKSVSFSCINDPLPGLRKILIIKSLLKMIENDFYCLCD